MKSSRVLLLSVFITAVVLVVVGAVSTMVLANKNTNTVDQAKLDETIAAYQQREAEYAKLIDQANQQLAKANAQLQAIRTSQGQGPSQAAPAASQASSSQPASNQQQPAASVAVSADQAAQKAMELMANGETPTKNPDLVSFQGKAAYEVAFEAGSVYVDAQTGEILFNGTVPQEITGKMAAQVASDYLKIKTGVSQIDEITFRGQQIYRVIFKNGTIAYLDKTGQITYVHLYDPNASSLQASADFGGGGGGGGGGHHESEHEHDDD